MSIDNGLYLVIPADYAERLDGLRWSQRDAAIENRSGDTFAFAPQVWQFLEGFMSERPLLDFAHMLHLLYLLGIGPITRLPEQTGELVRAFLLAGRPLRNAGVFCAQLCLDLPGTSLRIEPALLRPIVLHRATDSYGIPAAPPLLFDHFQQRVL